MSILELRSPAVCVDLDIFKANCREIRRQADASNKKIRAHFKAHRSLYLAGIQKELCADGFVAAKLAEAETLVNAGFDDILIAYPLYGKEKWIRYSELNKRAKLMTTVDSLEIAKGLSEYSGEETPANVLIELDVGTHRCGTTLEKLPELACELLKLPGINVCGIFSYNATLYTVKTNEERAALAMKEQEAVREAKKILSDYGIDNPYVSSGNSPATVVMDSYTEATEIRVGNRFFNDVCAMETNLSKESDCALTIHTTVVSLPEPGHATIDAGSKTFTTDPSKFGPNAGYVLSPRGITFTRVNEEHGYLTFDPNEVELKIGDEVIIIPNHACVIHNITDFGFAMENGELVQKYPVDARGLSY